MLNNLEERRLCARICSRA